MSTLQALVLVVRPLGAVLDGLEDAQFLCILTVALKALHDLVEAHLDKERSTSVKVASFLWTVSSCLFSY